MDAYNITSTFYPNQYSLTKDCFWTVTMTADQGQVKVEFLDLHTPPAYDKILFSPSNITEDETDRDWLPDTILVLSGYQPPRSLLVTSPEFHFAWDPSLWSTANNDQRGFAVRVSLASINGNVH